MAEFKLDLSKLQNALTKSPQAVGKGASLALTDIKNDWVADSVDIAPIDTHNLQKQIEGKVFDPGTDGHIEVSANAVREGSGKWKRFNYAYYIHEDKGRALTGEKKFLDKPAEQNTAKWQKWLEEEVEKELKKAGW